MKLRRSFRDKNLQRVARATCCPCLFVIGNNRQQVARAARPMNSTIYFRLILFLLILPLSVQGTIHRIESGGTIAPILESAAPFDTVWLASGDYYESIRIETPILLTGDAPRIHGGYTGHTIFISAPGTIINGIHVSESGERLIEDMACIRIEADSVEVRNCTITKPLHGIYLKGGSYSNIHHNSIEGRLDLIESDRGNGIHLWNSRHNRVTHNEIFNTRDGIYFSFADSTFIEYNHIHHVRYGLHYMYSNVNRFTENRFEENVAGAALMYSQEIMFYRNIFARCRGFRAYGILYQSMDRSYAKDNLILDNSRGLYFFNSDGNEFYGNDVVDNDLALQLNGSCENNLISNNNFIGNLSNLLSDETKTKTNWTANGKGNYWSNYKGYDLDGDNIGDVPHNIQNVFQIIETEIPEIRFYLLSPAAEILEIAERTLPILRLGSESDSLPMFRPLENSLVPWDQMKHFRADSSKLGAMIYVFGSITPLTLLLIVSRKKKN